MEEEEAKQLKEISLIVPRSEALTKYQSSGYYDDDDDTYNNNNNNNNNNNDDHDCTNNDDDQRTCISELSGDTFLGVLESSVAPSQQSTSTGTLKIPLSPQPHPQSRRSNNNSDGLEATLALDKLNVAGLGLYGRDREQAVLKQALEQLGTTTQRHLILISGVSGTGKTSLANVLQAPTVKRGGLFVRGKFDPHLRKEPYSGVALACAEICGRILALQMDQPALAERVYRRIQVDLGSELPLLFQFIPVLREVIDVAVASSEGGGGSGQETVASCCLGVGGTSEEAKNRFQFAFQRFVRIISEDFAPLVIVLDDLQWADASSLDLLDALVSDSRNNNNNNNSNLLLVVGIYRSNEVADPTHVFHRAVTEFQKKHKASGNFHMTEIHIGDLDIAAVNKVIEDLLSMKKSSGNSRTLGLAQVCLKKTNGNPLFLLHFLTNLHETHLIQFDSTTACWKWNETEIDANSCASANVVDLLKAKMIDLPTGLDSILKLAAFLGSTFEVPNLKLVWEASLREAGDDQQPQPDLASSLDALEEAGFIKRHPQSSATALEAFSWTHDKIQEAAQSLIPEDERPSFGRKVGEVLLSQLDPTDLESAIFVVANLLNGGDEAAPAGPEERWKIARLNYEASQKAVSLSAFESAAEYASKGIALLPDDDKWSDQHYHLSLGLYSIGAQSEGYLGNVEMMEHYCDQVLSQEDKPFEDKFAVYNTWIDSSLSRLKIDEAADLVLDVLKRFHCRFPKNPALIAGGLVANLARVKVRGKNRDVDQLAEMKDPIRLELMRLLDKLFTIFYFMDDDRMPLAVFRSLNYTIQYGYCDYSSSAFSLSGMILTGVFGDIQGGSHYGEQALKLMKKSRSSISHSRTLFVAHAMLFSWTKPLHGLLKPLLQGYDVGLRAGDPENAMWSIQNWLEIQFIMGVPLGGLEADYELYCKQMKDFKRDTQYFYSSYSRQVMLNLMGRNRGNMLELLGTAFTAQDLEMCKDNPFLALGSIAWHGVLLTYFGEHVRHADITLRNGHDYLQNCHVSSPLIPLDTTLKGISCFIAACKTKERKYFKNAEKMRAKIKKWHSLGDPNVKHYESLLDAEYSVYKGRRYDAIKNYEIAVLLAAKNGDLHSAAFASERLAEFLLRSTGDREEAAHRIDQAVRYWSQWGAMAKVDDVEKKYSHLFPRPQEIFTLSESGEEDFT